MSDQHQPLETTPHGIAESRSGTAQVWRLTRPYRPVLALLAVLVLLGGTTQPAFLTRSNLQNLLSSQSVLWIVALGMTFVLVSGGLDLSVGALATFVGILLAKLLNAGLSPALILVVVVMAGALIGGLVNGFLVAKLSLSVFVVTLASMTALTGAVQLWSGSASFFVTNPFCLALGTSHFLGLPVPVCCMIATFVLALYVERRTYFGRDIYAVGGNIVAAKLSGIRTARTLIAVYAIMGGATALAGAIAVGRIGAATPQVDNSLALQAIAAALLGGTALSGGVGSVLGTALGVLFIGGLGNLLSISGVPQAWQQVLTGLILVIAVSSHLAGRRRKRGSTQSGNATASGAGPALDSTRPVRVQSTDDLAAASVRRDSSLEGTK
jgi:ribose transport system permease protein